MGTLRKNVHLRVKRSRLKYTSHVIERGAQISRAAEFTKKCQVLSTRFSPNASETVFWQLCGYFCGFTRFNLYRIFGQILQVGWQNLENWTWWTFITETKNRRILRKQKLKHHELNIVKKCRSTLKIPWQLASNIQSSRIRVWLTRRRHKTCCALGFWEVKTFPSKMCYDS